MKWRNFYDTYPYYGYPIITKNIYAKHESDKYEIGFFREDKRFVRFPDLQVIKINYEREWLYIPQGEKQK